MDRPQIFENYTFWVAQRVPRRAHLVNTIKSHGGKHTRVEQNADFLIADASRSDAPRGAYSHELILDSSENGNFQILDRYRIGEAVRPTGSEGPAKLMRKPFTHEEDCRLAKFVLEQPDKQNGNKIYQEFGEQWPSHPWMSWRDRWVKRLANMPRSKLDDMVREAEASQEESSRSIATPAQAQSAAQGDHQPAPDNNQATEADDNASGDEDQDERKGESQELNDEDLAQRAQNHFYLELSDFTEQKGLRGQIHPFHTIGDVEFGLWDVFMAYADQEVEPEHVQLGEVAEYLGLDGSDAAVAKGLGVIWEQNLLEFVRQRALQAGDDEEDKGEMQEGDAQTREESPLFFQDADDEANRSQLYDTAPQSPPIPPPQESSPVAQQSSPPIPHPSQSKPQSSGAGPSRSSPQKRTQYQSQALPSRKRRRLAPDAEIPSTPDEVLGVVRPSIEEKDDAQGEGLTPSQKLSSSVQRRLFGQVEVRDSQEDSQAAFTQAQNKTPKRSTQKAKQPIVLHTQTTVVDVSPSQQLQAELATSASKRATAPRREEQRNGLRRDTSPTPKEVVPRTQVSTQTRTPNPSKSPSKKESPAKTRVLPKVDVPRAVVPPKRKLPSTFAKDSQIQTRAPAPKLIPKAPTPLSETATSSRQLNQHQAPNNQRRPLDDYDPDSQDPLNEPPARPKLTSGLSTLEDWITHYQTLGYPRKMVIVALKATTMTPGGQAAHTMESIQKGGGIPSNYEGVWTDRDDRGLAAVDNLERELGEELYVPKGAKFNVKGKGTLDRAAKMRKEKARLLDKHGTERMKLRLRFLEAEKGVDGAA